MTINGIKTDNSMEARKPEPAPPPPPLDIQAIQKDLDASKDRLKSDPNDEEAKRVLASLERAVSKALESEQAKGDQADPNQLDQLEKLLADIQQTMKDNGVKKGPTGGNNGNADPLE